MVSFDLSTMNIILTVAVVGLFTFFIALLIKLNPSKETKQHSQDRIEVDRQRIAQPSPIVQQSRLPPRNESPRVEAPRIAERPLVTVNSTVAGPSIQTKQVTTAPTPAPFFRESREVSRQPEKTATPARAEAFPTRKDCMHQFGYLRTFPKNSPIPDECFGCERIVDCLVNNKKSNGKNERWR